MKKQLWSEESRNLTKSTIDDLLAGMFRGAKCHLKKKGEGGDNIHGYIKNDPKLMFMDNPLIKIISSGGEEEWTYKSSSDVVEEGWAVD